MSSFKRAIVRRIPSSFANALCAVPATEPIDVEKARAQHATYVDTLRACGLQIVEIEADERLPDACFVEDRAVVAAGVALLTASAAPSRAEEAEALEPVLARWLRVVRMQAPATLDGGDCLRVGRTFFVGRSARTNAAGVAALRDTFEPLGYQVREIPVERVLHLKCVCAPLDDTRFTLAEGTVAAAAFHPAEAVMIPRSEEYAANCVAIGDCAVVSAGYPETARRLTAAGFTTVAVDTSEIHKADGALTCMSILI